MADMTSLTLEQGRTPPSLPLLLPPVIHPSSTSLAPLFSISSCISLSLSLSYPGYVSYRLEAQLRCMCVGDAGDVRLLKST